MAKFTYIESETEPGVLVYKLHKVITDEETHKLRGSFLERSQIGLIIDHDADGYDAETGQLIFRFRKNSLNPAILAPAYNALKNAANSTNTRGVAAGKIGETPDGEPIFYYNVETEDGNPSKNRYAKSVDSGIIGFMSPTGRTKFCRETSFNAKNPEKFAEALPIIQAVSEKYRELCPRHYEAQLEEVKKTRPEYIIPGTVFTTVSVNRNFQTAVHTDTGDFDDGFGNITVLEAGNYTGSEFCFPQYGCGIDVRTGDVALVDVHRWHGNLAMKPAKRGEKFYRISLVMYYRRDMVKCDLAENQLEKLKRRATELKIKK